MRQKKNVVVNGRDYSAPSRPAVVICLDGCEPEYLDKAMAAGLMPNLVRIKSSGVWSLAKSAIPSFTNPNNLSIATGRPSDIHGICGNYFYELESKQEVMMNDVRFLRAPTIFKAFYDQGARVAVVTAKDKLRALLGCGLSFEDERAVCFSSEKSGSTTKKEHGIDNVASWLGLPVPDVYSAALSEMVFAAGVKLLADWKPDLMYLSTTDFIQHKYAPGTPVANDFYAMFDKYLGQLDDSGAAIVATADHGMKPKHDEKGKPRVIYVQDLLDQWSGKNTARVILPITDPYVLHHGALGSFATAYLPDGADTAGIAAKLSAIEGMDLVLNREEACRQFHLPPDRVGDLVMLSTASHVLGSSVEKHDLSALDAPLRSHGGLHEQTVPFFANFKMDMSSFSLLSNYDAFMVALKAASK